MPLLHLLRQNPVIAAVKDNASLQLAIALESENGAAAVPGTFVTARITGADLYDLTGVIV